MAVKRVFNPQTIANARAKKARREEIAAAYDRLQSLRKVGAEFGLSHERVRQIVRVMRGG